MKAVLLEIIGNRDGCLMGGFNPFGSDYKGITAWMNRKVMFYLGIGLVILIIYRYFLE